MNKIYQITNNVNGVSYIGSTTGQIEERFNDHLRKSAKKVDNKFYKAIIEFGAESFTTGLLDTAETIDDLAQKEKHYIKAYNSLQNGYNSDCGGGFRKTVYQYDYTTHEKVNQFENLEDASNAVNASKKSVSNACLGYNKSCMGYVWSYSSTCPETVLDSRLKPVYQHSTEGEFIKKFDSLSIASKELGISQSCIGRCCRGERKQTSGFTFKY